MRRGYTTLLRQPDSVLFQFDDSGIRFEEPANREEQNTRLDYTVENGCGKLVIYPAEKPIKRVKLRWRGDLADVLMVLGDTYERAHATDTDWTGLSPRRLMPWYFYAYDGEALHGWGVKTGPNAFAEWQCDAYGITLWLDVRSGSAGVHLKEPLLAAEIVCRKGEAGEKPYDAAVALCKMMCEKPNLPKEPIFGVNNWYWAYGNITHESVMTETEYLMEMCQDAMYRPYMILDDGWQVGRVPGSGFNGGPWDASNAGFPSMEDTAAQIRAKGAKPGIWFRPLCSKIDIPEGARSRAANDCAYSLDPSHPFVLNQVAEDVARIRSWGYELIKHDFTTMDSLKVRLPLEDGQWTMYDNTITSAQALKRLYRTIQDAANGAVVIGCNTINHLAAGIHEAQRSGDDTSGRSFEITRNTGVHTFLRLPQNGTFFAHDPDCAAFTDMVSHELNLDFLEAAAMTGAVTLASVTPGSLTLPEMVRIRGIYRMAAMGGVHARPNDWLGNNEPCRFGTADHREYRFDWYRAYDGVRTYYTWNY